MTDETHLDGLMDEMARRIAEHLAVELRPPERPFLTPGEVAERLGIGERTVWGQIGSGVLPSVKVGRRRMVPRAEFEAWLVEVGASARKRSVRERKAA